MSADEWDEWVRVSLEREAARRFEARLVFALDARLIRNR